MRSRSLHARFIRLCLTAGTVATVAGAPSTVLASEGPPAMGAVSLLGSRAVLSTVVTPRAQMSDSAGDEGRELPPEQPPGARYGWLAVGGLGLVGGAVLTTAALSAGVAPDAGLGDLAADPGSFPVLSAGASSLALGYLATRVGLYGAGGRGQDARFVFAPRVSLSHDSFSVGLGGRF